ncbi:ABC transporter substrate-binding protein [Thaumasiovibrio subtropicus]|uniref:ABC transporter substrate-binding protein n=1 Tax=Thaumasiovibrio subtropicus TaxID=1891207 RepID=UPI000B35F6F8|nr:ABC transporter substrate-binding protein [Thaumasiovibrio subtropicus]
MNKNKITQALLLATGLAFSSAPTFAAEVPAGIQLAEKQELVRGNGTEVASIDPHKTEGVPESNVIRDLLEGLVNQDENGATIPGVAERWETEDNQTFVFHLREAMWSNGDPVTAADFEYSFKRAADPVTASPYSWYLDKAQILNAKAIIDGKADKETLGVRAIDERTLEIKLETPVPYFVKMMGHTTVKPVHRGTIEKFGDQWTRPENFVGNGAYTLSNWVVNERIELTRNTQYWDDAKTVIEKVTYLPIENQVAEMNRFMAGELHMTNELPNEHFRRLQKNNPESVKIVGNLCSYYYGFNNEKAPFDDVRVRTALSYAIDRDVITKALLGQGQVPAYFFTPEITEGFEPVMPDFGKLSQKERVEKAQALLADAGFDKSNPLNFTLLYNTSENHRKLAVAIASMWKTALGVDVNLENQEWKTYLDNRRAGNFDVTRAGWCADYNEASAFLALMRSDNGSNDPRYASEAYDKLMDAALVAATDGERNGYYQQAEIQLAQDMPIAPIYHYVRARLVNPKVGGYPDGNAEDKIFTKDLYLIK